MDFKHWLETEILRSLMGIDRARMLDRRDVKDALEQAYNKGWADHLALCDEREKARSASPG